MQGSTGVCKLCFQDVALEAYPHAYHYKHPLADLSGVTQKWVAADPHEHPHTVPLQLHLSQPDHQPDAPTSLVAALHAEDQASNLLWRLQNGQVFVKHPAKVAIVLIGINDLGAGGSCGRGEPGATAAANGTALRSLCCSAFCLSVLCLPVCSLQCSVLSPQCSVSVLSAQCSVLITLWPVLCHLVLSAQCKTVQVSRSQ